MRLLIKRLFGSFRIPVTQWYLRKERTCRFGQIQITVPPGVFHPGLFPSTKLLLAFIGNTDLKGKRVLDLGTGTGILAIAAAQRGADATATDVSGQALSACERNAALNHVNLILIRANVWHGLPEIQFDYILINPPYYRKNPSNDAEMAWYCGENMEYFRALFAGLAAHLSPGGRVMMTFTEDAGLPDLQSLAGQFSVDLEIRQTRKHWPDGADYLLEATIQG